MRVRRPCTVARRDESDTHSIWSTQDESHHSIWSTLESGSIWSTRVGLWK